MVTTLRPEAVFRTPSSSVGWRLTGPPHATAPKTVETHTAGTREIRFMVDTPRGLSVATFPPRRVPLALIRIVSALHRTIGESMLRDKGPVISEREPPLNWNQRDAKSRQPL